MTTPNHPHNLDLRSNPRASFIDLMSPASELSNMEFVDPSADSEGSPIEAGDQHVNRSDVRSSDGATSDQFHSSLHDRPSPKRPTSSQFELAQTLSSGPISNFSSALTDALPPITNPRRAKERADLIKKQRKLAQVFGQPPGHAAFAPKLEAIRLPNRTPSEGNKYGHRHGSLSMSSPSSSSSDWPHFDGTHYLSAHGRRHSMALSPDEFGFPNDNVSNNETGQLPKGGDEVLEVGSQSGPPLPDSPTSFMNLSDEDGDVSSMISTPKKRRQRDTASASLSSLYSYDSLTPEEQAEEDRRRKREKLVKLHRFLGSRVPVDLVLGDSAVLLPLPASPLMSGASSSPISDVEVVGRRPWLRRKRSTSLTAIPDNWSDLHDRLREDLDEKEKAINVRRAHKMEKVFGVLPPQNLYHTRHSSRTQTLFRSTPSASDITAPHTRSASTQLTTSGSDQSAYLNKNTKKTHHRLGTTESSQFLLPSGSNSGVEQRENVANERRSSIVYTHYQQSLNSLVDIIDKDDKKSLNELHQYLHGDSNNESVQDLYPSPSRKSSFASSLKSERRRSLPTRASMTSINSEFSITSPTPEVSEFQMRRRRAAKLQNFFGVDYKDLIHDVVESIEKGVEEDGKRGTLNADELQDLAHRLRTLKAKRGSGLW